MSTVQIQNDIIDDFKILDGDLEMTLNYLMELGESLNDLDEKYKIDDNLVKGCQSKVWLKCTKEDDKIYLEGDSNTAITKGLLSILIKIFNKKTPEEIYLMIYIHAIFIVSGLLLALMDFFSSRSDLDE